MHIRPAENHDIPAIVGLLKLSLGDAIPKSEDYWRWKHVDNPFGVSPVLLAFDVDILVGVRAFMCWKWQVGQKVYQAVRAVDTATHPAHQGKGIFKKLTLTLVDQCKRGDVDFVFNTPNQSSKPGYLKMGWQEAGRLAVSLKCRKPLSILMHAAGFTSHSSHSQKIPVESGTSLDYFLAHPSLGELLVKDRANQVSISTKYSVEYLIWRYKQVRVVNYFAVGFESGNQLFALVIYRIKPGRAGDELRITDIFLESAKYRPEVATLIADKMNVHNVEFMTVSATHKWIFDGIFSFNKLRIGPIVTIRDVKNGPMELLQNFREWSPSLGDLELF